MKLKSLFIILNALNLTVVFIVIMVILDYKSAFNKMEEAHISKYRSFVLSDELRQSSDDLTRLVRTYVVTTNIRFKEQYYEVLAIRNGLHPRPKNYNKVYWDFLAVEGASNMENPSGDSVGLRELMVQAGFTKKELSYLNQAQDQSDALVKLEEKAMHAVDGIYKDKDGLYTIIGKPDLKSARDMLHSEEYHEAKVKIMKPINDFLKLLEARTDRSIHKAKVHVKSVEELLDLMVFFLILTMTTSMGIMLNRILRPLLSLKQSMLKLANNDTNILIPLQKNKDEIGDMISAVSIFKTNTEKLIVSEQKVKLLFDSVGEGFFGLDAKGVFTFINPAGCEILGYSSDELIGHYLYKTVKVHDLPNRVNKLLLNHGAKTTGVMEIQDKTGRSFPAEYTSTPILGKEDQIEGSVVVFSDITQRKRQEDDLKHAKENAESANRSKTLFLANMSHELRTPLNAILGFTQLILKDSNLKPKQKENLETIYKSGKHLLNIISEILEVAKLQAGKIEIVHNSFDLHSFFNNIILIFENRALAKGITFSCDDYTQLPRFVINDEQRLRQILFNLLSNAIKFTSVGNIHLGLRYEKQDLFCVVSDTGPGIGEKDIPIIFRPFEQIKSAQGFQKGTGLGLSISKELVTLMGGKIHVESTLGQGTKFYFNVMSPQAQIGDSVQVNKGKNFILSSTSPSYKVLVVDDIYENRSLLVQMLQYLGFDTCEANDGKNALTQLSICRPDIIFMDLQMPDMNGYEVIGKIRSGSIDPDIPIVLVSANVFDENRQKAIDEGANAFIGKPIQEEKIILALQNLLQAYFIPVDTAKNDAATIRPITTRLNKEQIQAILKASEELDMTSLETVLQEYLSMDESVVRYMQQCLHNYEFSQILSLGNFLMKSKID